MASNASEWEVVLHCGCEHPTRVFLSNTGLFQPSRVWCIECFSPHCEALCDGTKTQDYRLCAAHPTSEHDCHCFQNIKQPLVDPRSSEATAIRKMIVDEYLALLCTDTIDRCQGSMRQPCGSWTLIDEEKFQAALVQMLKPTKRHINNCLHSDNPAMIISRSCADNNDTGGRLTEQKTNTSKLAIDLYFKRCDGTYKNVLGQVLIVKGET
jgi:hypothetical protein